MTVGRWIRRGAGAIVFALIALVILFEAAFIQTHAVTVTADFARGDRMTTDAEDAVREAMTILSYADDLWIDVVGHTSVDGDDEANRALALNRAQAVADALIAAGLDRDRLRFVHGVGGDEPLAREEGESARAYARRLGRVELRIQAGARG